MISGIDGLVLSVWILFMAVMLSTCLVVPWPGIPLSDTNVLTTRVTQYSSSILSSIMTP